MFVSVLSLSYLGEINTFYGAIYNKKATINHINRSKIRIWIVKIHAFAKFSCIYLSINDNSSQIHHRQHVVFHFVYVWAVSNNQRESRESGNLAETFGVNRGQIQKMSLAREKT